MEGCNPVSEGLRFAAHPRYDLPPIKGWMEGAVRWDRGASLRCTPSLCSGAHKGLKDERRLL